MTELAIDTKAPKDLREAAAAETGQYKFRLACFAMLGYAVVFGVLLLLVGLLAAVIGTAFLSTALFLLLLKKKLIFVIVPAIWIMARALWVRFDPPEGYSLDRERFPELFREIDDIAQSLQAPKVHDVILTPELNAAVSQTPRWGIFGNHQNTLIIGLELLMVMSPAQARAVLAHEFGHLSGNHSRFNAWIYRVRMSWHRIMSAFHQEDNIGANMMRKFFDWYSPRFSQHSFALARLNEYEADAVSAEKTSDKDAGDALVNVHVVGPYVDQHYWQSFFRTADERSEPEHMPWRGLSDYLANDPLAQADLQESLKRAMEGSTGEHDTHPALVDRLSALNVEPSLSLEHGQSAAEVWLAGQFDQVLADFDKQWWQDIEERWKNRFEYVQDSNKTLTGLESKAGAELSDEELWQMARLIEEFKSGEQALPYYRQYQQRYPEDGYAAFAIGRLAYEKKDGETPKQMELAFAERQLTDEACRYAYYYLTDAGEEAEAEKWRQRLIEFQDKEAAADAERRRLEPEDEIENFEIAEDFLEHVRQALQGHEKVKQAWICRKKVQHYPEDVALVIGFQPKTFTWSFSETSLTQSVIEALNLRGDYFVVQTNGDLKKLGKKIRKIGQPLL